MACASTVTIDWQSGGSFGVFDPAGMQIGTITGPAPIGQVATRAGRFVGEIVSTSPDMTLEEFYLAPDHFFAYCHDLSEILKDSTYEIAFGASAAVLDFLGAVNAVLLPGNNSPYDWLSPATKEIAGAIQLGIWEALYDTGFILSNELGRTNDLHFSKATNNTLDPTMLGHYNTFVAAMSTTNSLDGQYVMRLQNTAHDNVKGTQDVITGYVPPPRQLVPEPGTAALFGLAAVAAALARRRH